MTTEVAVLNRSAVALAADSAVSVESLSHGRMTTKVFNTANKLFTLSKVAPTGVMICNTMTIGGVPWESVIKEYRKHIGHKRFKRLEDYCNDFFAYLTNNRVLFSEKDQLEIVFSLVIGPFAELFHGKESELEIQ